MIKNDICVKELKEAIGEEGIRNLLLYIKKAIERGIEEKLNNQS